jgi:hypothetical protein
LCICINTVSINPSIAQTPLPPSRLIQTMLDFNDVLEPLHQALPLDKEELRARLLDSLEPALAYLFPHGKVQGDKFYVGDVNGNPGKSLVVELHGPRRGLWHDFATQRGGDMLELWAQARGLSAKGDFAELLRDIAQWLAVPVLPRSVDAALAGWTGHSTLAHSAPRAFEVAAAARSPSQRMNPNIVFDELGKATAKWDYLDAQGSLIACVYRYEPMGEDGIRRKEYRPWDAKRCKTTSPEPRPLYNQPGMLVADTVVLVEGEKCAQALIDVGICATTAMHGANAPVPKTDWSPLKGKKVILWPDNDEAGAAYMDAVSIALRGLVAHLARLTPPSDKPSRWDAADAIDDLNQGFEVQRFIQSATEVQGVAFDAASVASPERLNILQWQACERFKGVPQARQWLVQGVFPMAQPTLVAAAGGIGKSLMASVSMRPGSLVAS